MKINVLVLLTISILCFSSSCNDDDECQAQTGLQDEWIWVQSQGGLGGNTFTPESEMRTQRLIIDDFFFQMYVNDSLTFESEYDLGIATGTLLGTEEKTYIEFDRGFRQAIIIGDKELQLFDQCFDCFVHTYCRN